MRIVDCYVCPEDAEKVLAIAEERELRAVLTESEGVHQVRVFFVEASPDDFLDEMQEAIDFESDPDRFFVVSEALSITPQEDENGEGEPKEGDEKGGDERRAARDEIERMAEEGGMASRTSGVLMVASAVIAAAGLMRNNIAVIVGAMVIAPVFKPLVAIVIGLVLGRPRLALRGTAVLVLAMATAIAGGAVVALLTPGAGMSESLRVRSSISLFELVIALAAGVAAGYTVIRNDRLLMVGIVVAASLIPAAAALGILIVFGEGYAVAGASFTLCGNVSCILLGMIIVCRVEQVRSSAWRDRESGEKITTRALWVGATVTSLLVGVSVWAYLGDLGGSRRLTRIDRMLDSPRFDHLPIVKWEHVPERQAIVLYTLEPIAADDREELTGALRENWPKKPPRLLVLGP